MDLKGFDVRQKEALLDLALLAMYADGHLAAAEDERVQRLLGAMGLITEYERATHYDAAVSRVSRRSPTAQMAREHATVLAAVFSSGEQKRQVYAYLHDLVASDGRVSPAESLLLSAVRQALQE